METVATMARENSGTAPKLRTYAGIRGVTLMTALHSTGGLTLDFGHPTMDVPSHKTGYYIGGATKALVAPIADVDTRHCQYALREVWKATGGTGLFGMWTMGDNVYFEGASYHTSRTAAIMLASMTGQTHIWDIAAGESLEVF